MPKTPLKRRPRSLIHLATQIFNTPLMIHAEKLNVILAVLGPRLGLHESILRTLPRADEITLDMDAPEEEPSSDLQDGVCVIPIYGTLVKRSMPMDAMSGMTSYEDIRSQVETAMADPACLAVLFDIDSPGGQSAGMFELADYIFGCRGEKPMYAASNDSMYSAAYAIGSAADECYITNVGGAGSIGVYMLHVDKSEQDKMNGVKYTYIKSGDRKTEGNPHEPLSDKALEAAQAEVDRQRDLFVDLVARNRGLAADKVFNTQAACYYAQGAVAMGLCDLVGSMEDAMEDLCESLGAERSRSKVSMAGIKQREMKSALEVKSKLEAFAAAVKGLAESEADVTAIITNMVRDHGARTRPVPPHALVYAYPNSDIELHLRHFAVKATVQTSARTVTCLVAPYNQLSQDLGGFKEIYEPGCFSECLKQDDPRALFNHNPDYVLGRKSAGTARFLEKADGLYFEADAPDTQWANDLLVSMRRGDITQGSAAFFILKPRWEYRGSQKIRVIEQAKLVESSIASFAAYESTTASVGPDVAAEQEQMAARFRLLAL